MGTFLLIFVAALVLAIAATPLARRVALQTGVVDVPSSRKTHLRPTPLLGGLALYSAVVMALLLFGDQAFLSQLVGLVLGATLVSFLGIWDDSRGIRPFYKLLGQVTAGLILIVTGVQISLFPYPLLNEALTLLWVVGITNAFNLLDNIDGLSGGVAAVASAFFLLLAVGQGQFLVASLSAALLGACIGFLRYNFNPARIFMGDAGSLFLGFVLAVLGIKLRFGNVPIVTWMIPILVLGVPIFDTTLVTLSRLRRGLNPLTHPGRDHLSHRLVAAGMTPKEAVLTLYLASGALGMVAMWLSHATVLEAYLLAGSALLVALGALVRAEQMHYPGKTPQGEVSGRKRSRVKAA